MDIPDLPDWAKEMGTCGLGVPNVFMLEGALPGSDPGPWWLHWHDEPGKTPMWALGSLSQHDIISREPWHVEPSILCGPAPYGCNLHGFIRNDEWTEA